MWPAVDIVGPMGAVNGRTERLIGGAPKCRCKKRAFKNWRNWCYIRTCFRASRSMHPSLYAGSTPSRGGAARRFLKSPDLAAPVLIFSQVWYVSYLFP